MVSLGVMCVNYALGSTKNGKNRMGTLAYGSISGTTMTLNYKIAAGEDSANLHMIKYATGDETTQALSAGANTVTVVPGAIYLMASAYYDATPSLLGFGNFLFLRAASTSEGDDWLVRWRSDYDAAWLESSFDADEDRIRIPTNRRGHWFQYEIKGDAQNQRFELRNTGLEIRMAGPAYGARQS